MCIIDKNTYVRKIKTWRKNDIKIKENYYLRKSGVWTFCLGLNPSQTFNEFIDKTNLNLCNYFISNSFEKTKVKGYTLLNFSNAAKTKSSELEDDDFDVNHMKEINFALYLISKKKTVPIVFFYGRDKDNKKFVKKIIDEKFIINVSKLIANKQLHITINTREINENGKPNVNFNKFTHPADVGMGNDLGIRLADQSDLDDLM